MLQPWGHKDLDTTERLNNNFHISSVSVYISHPVYPYLGLPRWLSGKESACNAGATGDTGLIPGLGRSSGEGHGNPIQYSC